MFINAKGADWEYSEINLVISRSEKINITKKTIHIAQVQYTKIVEALEFLALRQGEQ